MDTVAYVSSQCINSRRFLDTLASLPHAKVRVIDIDVTPPPPGLEYVPTVISSEGNVLVGSQAFEFLKQLHNDISLASYLDGLNDDLVPF